MLIALTRTPSSSLASCALTHAERQPIDVGRALEQHAAYRRGLAELGVRVLNLPAIDALPDAAFVEDTAIVLEEVAVIARPFSESRRAECDAIAAALAPFRTIVRLDAPARLEGGDVLRAGSTLYVGQSRRTDHAGLKALAHLVLEHGQRVKAVPVRGALHLKTALTHLGRQTMLVNPAWVDLDHVRGFELLEVHPSEPFAANTLAIGDRVLMSSAFPRTIARVQERGFEVIAFDVSELAKAEAGLTCLSLVFPGAT